MKILCDQCVHLDIVHALIDAGFNTTHTSDVGLARASDMEIFRYAQRSRSILLTFDHGFGNITQFPIRNGHGIVLIYIASMNRNKIIEHTLHVFQHTLKTRKPAGQLIIVESDSIRIWPR